MLARGLLFLLAYEVGNWAGDPSYQGPVLIKADAAVMIGVQVLDELVSCLPVSRVCQHVVEFFLQHFSETALADLVPNQAVLGYVFVKVDHQDLDCLFQLCIAILSHFTCSKLLSNNPQQVVIQTLREDLSQGRTSSLFKQPPPSWP